MRVVFMGTPDFAVPSLEKLISCGHEVLAVFTQPDKPVGRKQVLTPSEVKQCAVKHNIPVYQPEKIKGSDTVDIIRNLDADAIIVVAYGKLLPPDVLVSAKFGCINVHGSLLPKYRGAAPIQWSVLNGDAVTGVTIMQMDEGIDTGDILMTSETEIGENETSAELFDRLAYIGADALAEALDRIVADDITPVPQPDGEYQYASMISREMCPIDWSDSAQNIHNKVRGLQTWPVALTKLNGKNLKIHATVMTDICGDKAGMVVDNNKRLVVACGDGRCIEIRELQLDGKKRMDVRSFMQGNPIPIGTVLGE